MANNVVFSISTELEMEGRELKAIKPNKDGIYTGIPLTVIGTHSRNLVNYERNSVLQCLTDKSSRFAMNVASGDQEGEWGHPLLDDENCLARLCYIDRKNVSHCFTKVYGKESNGLIIVYGDVKPFGPYKQNLIESFEDPSRNTSFSLRSAAVKTGQTPDGIVQKRMLALITFDAVDGPGFAQACKRFRDLGATESLSVAAGDKGLNVDVDVSREQFMSTRESLAGQESVITDQRILDAFGCDKVIIKEKVLHRRNRGQFVDALGNPISLIGECFGS